VFGAVQRGVGGADQLVGARAAELVGSGDTDADAVSYGRAAVQRRRVRQRTTQTLGDAEARFCVALGQDGDEFFAAQAPDGIIGAHTGLQAPRGFTQHGVASHVAMGIVDGLEMIEVAHQHGDRGAAT